MRPLLLVARTLSFGRFAALIPFETDVHKLARGGGGMDYVIICCFFCFLFVVRQSGGENSEISCARTTASVALEIFGTQRLKSGATCHSNAGGPICKASPSILICSLSEIIVHFSVYVGGV